MAGCPSMRRKKGQMKTTMGIEKDVNRIRLLAEASEEENWQFRSYLKSANLSTAALDRLVWQHLEAVTRHIDCCACAQCCKVISPLLSTKDVRRLAGHLGMEKAQLITGYLRPSEDKGNHHTLPILMTFQHK